MKNAAKCFRDMRSPFDTSELRAQSVTADEVYDLSNAVAQAIEFWLRHKDQARDEALVQVVSEELGPQYANTFEAELKFRKSLKEVDRV